MIKNKKTLVMPDTKWWHTDGKKVVCDLCPRNCELSEGQRGFCFVRQNVGGEMHLTTYGKSTGFCIDPIEKKPLNHFLPGTPVLSFGTAGCNLGCKFCQNWDISKSKEIEILSSIATPEAIVLEAQKQGCRSIAFTYNDPIIWAEYAIDTAIVSRAAGIKTVAVTSGYINKKARKDFYKYMDAANVDLKAFSEQFYKKITLSELQPVLDTLKWLKEESNTWFEITNLLIPDENDSEDEIKRMCDWILRNLGDEVPIHFTAFHPDFKMLNKIRTPTETLVRAHRQACDVGIKYAYVGNVHHRLAQNTYCPGCKRILIERDWYELGEYLIKNGKCKFCNTKIAGVFEDKVGDWGSKRQPVTIGINEIKNNELDILSRDQLGMGKKNNLKNKNKQKNISNKSEETKKQIPATNISYTPRTEFTEVEKTEILTYVHGIIKSALANEDISNKMAPELHAVSAYGAFVTLKRGASLRGCRGVWGNEESIKLGDLLRDVAIDTALRDSRFPAVKSSEIPFLTIEISIMYDPILVEAKGQDRLTAFEVGMHGLVIISSESRGLLLPNVATENNWDAQTFLEQTCVKANLNKDSWLLESVDLITYKTVKFELMPSSPEFETECISEEMVKEFFELVDALENREDRELKVSKEILEVYNSQFGLQLESKSGHREIRFGIRKSILDLLRDSIKSIVAWRGSNQCEDDKIEILTILTQPIELFAEEYPYRVGTILNSALLAQFNDQATVTFPGNQRGSDPIAYTFNAAGASAEDWSSNRARLSAFKVKKVTRITKSNNPNIRTPAFVGKFYPAEPAQMLEVVDNFLGAYQEVKNLYPALMLPHAGWKYCGSVISKTLAGASIAPEVIIIGPKHTASGANLSLAAHEFWEIPGSRIPLIPYFRDFLIDRVPGLVADTEAHANEHGVEVLLPFLKRVQPELRILPIAIGALNVLELENMAKGIAELFVTHLNKTKRPIQLIISSDMNHFSPDEENRRRDKLALEAIKSGQYMNLLNICREEQISMCGALPAVIVMQALNLIFKGYKANVSAYQTSATVTGDTSSVVGYAGVRFAAI
jgi:AmmeMemoRadiSam system radical SAM enzyme/AmmeMemoRadiSam system protein B/AmmeMemoRadiSam system protein A